MKCGVRAQWNRGWPCKEETFSDVETLGTLAPCAEENKPATKHHTLYDAVCEVSRLPGSGDGLWLGVLRVGMVTNGHRLRFVVRKILGT